MSVFFWSSIFALGRVKDDAHIKSLVSPNARRFVEESDTGLVICAEAPGSMACKREGVHMRVGTSAAANGYVLPVPTSWRRDDVPLDLLCVCPCSPMIIRQLAASTRDRTTCFDWWLHRTPGRLPLSLMLNNPLANLRAALGGLDGLLLSFTVLCADALEKLDNIDPIHSVETVRLVKVGKIDSGCLDVFPMLRQLTIMGNPFGCDLSTTVDLSVLNSGRQLHHLRLQECYLRGTFTRQSTFTELETVHVQGCSLQSPLPMYSEMPSLKFLHLDVTRSEFDAELPSCPVLHAATISSPTRRGLQSLLQGCTSLRRLEILRWKEESCPSTELSGVASSLQKLLMTECVQLRHLELSVWSNLVVLEVRNCPLLLSCELRGSSALQEVIFESCRGLQSLEGLQCAVGLRSLQLVSCDALLTLDLSGNCLLENLLLKTCSSLQSVTGFRSACNLRSLEIIYCSAMAGVDIGGRNCIERIRVEGDEQLLTPDLLGLLSNLRYLEVSTSAALTHLSLGGNTQIEHIRLRLCPALLSVSGLASAPQLQSLEVCYCAALTCLDLHDNSSLDHLWVEGCDALQSFGRVTASSKQLAVELVRCDAIRHIDMAQLSSVTRLGLKECQGLSRIDGLGCAARLHSLQVFGCDSLVHLDLDCNSSLVLVSVRQCEQLLTVEGLQSMPSLRSFSVRSCSALQYLDVGEHSPLKDLHLDDCGQLKFVRGMQRLAERAVVTVRGCGSVAVSERKTSSGVGKRN